MKTLLIVPLLCGLIAGIFAVCPDPDMKNCDTCDNPPLQCKYCPYGWGMKDDKSGCLECSDNCYQCHESGLSTACDVCYTGYALQVDETCLECSDGCAKCNILSGTVTECEMCYDPSPSNKYYVLTAVLKTCAECPTNCKVCTEVLGETTCSTCKDGYTKKRSDGSCMKCPNFCESCRDNGEGKAECTSCSTGYEVNLDDATSACLWCPSTCSSCEGTPNGAFATCTDCNTGFVLQGGSCGICTSNCIDCADQTQCADCNSGFRLDAGQCDGCPLNCLECSVDADGDEVCDTCMSYYGAKAKTSASCDWCGSNCFSCSEDRCTICNSGYAVDADGKCTKCPSNCNECSVSAGKVVCKSTKCFTDFAYNSLDGQCYACPDNCKSGCSYNKNNARTECTTCDPYFVSTDEKQCTDCPANCNDCYYNATLASTFCELAGCDGLYAYALEGVSCEACREGCLICSYNDSSAQTDCTEPQCDTGYRFISDDSSCEPCADGCTACNATHGEAAADRYVLTTDGVCAECPANCYLCKETNNGIECNTNKCDQEWEENDGACVACPSNCLTCTYDNNDVRTECTSTGCKSRYATDVSDGSCKSCPSNCDDCTYVAGNSRTECKSGKCFTGYALNSDDGRCYACPANCATCTYSNEEGNAGTICSLCNSLYDLDEANNLCVACPDNCNLCTFNVDTGSTECDDSRCDGGYGRKSDFLCYECPNHCFHCPADENDLLICDVCDNGYRVNEGTCGACVQYCTTCTDNEGTMECSTCKDGYALKSSDKTCTKCPSNCLDCKVSSSDVVTCSLCQVGYGISLDKSSCTSCDQLMFDDCATCTDESLNGTMCLSCEYGYAMRDDMGACEDCSTLTDCSMCEDRGTECSLCGEDYEVTAVKDCAFMCYTCGDKEAGDWRTEEECAQIELPKKDEFDNNTVVPCYSGYACYAFSRKTATATEYTRGCYPEIDECKKEKTKCDKTTSLEECSKCCVGNRCNDFKVKGGGVSAPVVSMGAILVVLVAMLM